MGRLRTSFISAMNYTNELITNGEEQTSAIHKAALRFNEDETQLKNKIEKNTKKKDEDSKKENKETAKEVNKTKSTRWRKPKTENKETTQSQTTWISYVGPIYITNKKRVEIISAKAKTINGKDNKEIIENLISTQKNTQIEIKEVDWKYYAKEFSDESKCDKHISRKTFNNAFEAFDDSKEKSTKSKVPFTPTDYNFKKKYKVNEDCSKMVKKFNNLKEKKFQDYLLLKTFGNDGLSPLRFRDIVKQVPSDELMYAQGEIDGEDNLSTCLKWRLRGLSIDDAIEKVKVDNLAKAR